MKIDQLYTKCLAEAAYYIESEGEAAIIDPLRETEPYIEMAKENNTKIKYVFETHFHADFVSGHIDLAKETGATIIYGPGAKTNYNIHEAKDGETFKIGKLTIKVLHTPGHTPESTTYLLLDENGKEHCIFTGDTLFIGDVGRPDLAVKGDLTQEDLAGLLFDSLRNKIMTLPDEVIVYPAHGAGSACGKNMSKETFSTLGEQKQSNYALQDLTKDDFIAQVTDGIAPPPQYFPKNAMMNKNGYSSVNEVLEAAKIGLDVPSFKEKMEGAIILDVRHQDEFRKGFIPNSINIPLDGSFASWVGTLIEDIHAPILIISNEDRVQEAVLRLSRVGYDNTIGYLLGGITAWTVANEQVNTMDQVSVNELEIKLNEGKLKVLDVRKPSEYEAEHVENAINFPLDYINENIEKLDKSATYFVHCKSGYRSMAASSILRKNGFNNIIDIYGGIDAILESNIKVTDYVCPSTKL